MGVVVLGAVGWAMCILGSSATSEWSTKNPFTVAMWAASTAAHALAREPRMRVRRTRMQVHAY